MQKDLFCRYTLAIYSGTVGGTIREKQYTFDSSGEKDAVLKALFDQKLKEGFKVIYRYPREHEKTVKRDTA